MPDLSQPPWSDFGRFLSGTAVPIAVTIVFAWVFLAVAERFVERLLRRLMDREASEGTARELTVDEVQRRIGTVSTLVASLLRVLVVTITVIMVLSKFNVEVGPAIAGLGIVGIAVGFGAQSLVKDYFNGVLILVENQFAKGDVVRIAGVAGTVEDFTLRRTTLRDADGVVHSVPNGQIEVASNLTRLWARINENVDVAYGTDIDRATRVVDEVGRAMEADPDWHDRILETPQVIRVEKLGEYGVTLKIWGAVRAEDRWAGAGEFRKRLLAAFQEHGIEIPRPQRVMLTGDPVAGGGPLGGAPLGGGAGASADAPLTTTPPPVEPGDRASPGDGASPDGGATRDG